MEEIFKIVENHDFSKFEKLAETQHGQVFKYGSYAVKVDFNCEQDQYFRNLIQEKRHSDAHQHNFAPKIHESKMIESTYVFIMDYINGHTFTEFIRKTEDFDIQWKTILNIFDKLYKLHKNVGYHGDLNPNNIMIEKSEIKFIDFTKRFGFNTLCDYTQFFYYFSKEDGLCNCITAIAIYYLLCELNENQSLLNNKIGEFLNNYMLYLGGKRSLLKIETIVFNKLVIINNINDDYCEKNSLLNSSEFAEKFKVKDKYLLSLYYAQTKNIDTPSFAELRQFVYDYFF